MIKEYSDGESFINENKDYLNENKFMNAFFFLDAPFYKTHDKKNYAFKVENENKKLLIFKTEPYIDLLYGSKELVKELADYLINSLYEFDGFLSEEELGLELKRELSLRNIVLEEAIPMDFMVCKTKNNINTSLVEHGNIDDVDEISSLRSMFQKECGLQEQVIEKDVIKKTIDDYRLIRKDGVIVSILKISSSSPIDKRIAFVYSRKEYRGNGYSKTLIKTSVNEIIDNGFVATLNVDKRNPISNHIYYDAGFRKIFSQSEFRVKKINKAINSGQIHYFHYIFHINE